MLPTKKIGPEIVDLGVTSACNHKCYFCEQHSYLRTDSHRTPETLDEEAVHQILQDCIDLHVQKITLAANGEQLLVKYIPEILHKYSNKIDFQLATNGSSLKKIDKELFSCLADLTISINAVMPFMHQLIHGYKGNEQLTEIRKDLDRILGYNGAQTKILISYAITKDNISEFDALMKFVEETECRFSIRPLHLNIKELADNNKGLSTTDVTELLDKIAIYGKTYQKNNRIRAILKNLEFSLRENERVGKKSARLGMCMFAIRTINIWSDGSVTQCTYSQTPIGNIYQNTLSEIWKSKKMRTGIFKALTMSITQKPAYDYCRACTEQKHIKSIATKILGYLR